MGKGDKKTRRGKITMGSYGVKRPRKQSGQAYIKKDTTKPIAALMAEDVELAVVTEKTPVAKKKVAAKETEAVVKKATPAKKVVVKKTPTKTIPAKKEAIAK